MNLKAPLRFRCVDPDFDGWMEELVGQVPPRRSTTAAAMAVALGDPAASGAVVAWLRTHAPEVALAPEGTPPVITDFECSQPLIALQGEQRRLALDLILVDPEPMPARAVGLDVAYHGTQARGAAVEVDMAAGTVIRTAGLGTTVTFPYIPGYLYYREGPVLRRLLRRLPGGDRVVLVDGHGILHPRGCGLASHLGLATEEATVGMAKGGWSPTPQGAPRDGWIIITQGQRQMGWLHSGRGKPKSYVSPGHRSSLDGARRFAELIFRMKESPLAIADRLSRSTMGGVLHQGAAQHGPPPLAETTEDWRWRRA